MALRTWICGLLVLASAFPPTEAATSLYDPQLCYILDGFLGLYGLFITGMFIKEKFFKGKAKDDGVYSDLDSLASPRRDAERGRNQRASDNATYTDLTKRTDGEYKELPVKRERRKPDALYQGLSPATRDTYDSLQMQPLPAR